MSGIEHDPANDTTSLQVLQTLLGLGQGTDLHGRQGKRAMAHQFNQCPYLRGRAHG